MMWNGGCFYGSDGFGGGFINFGMIICIVAIVAICYVIFKKSGNKFKSDKSLDVLKMKYASGEISEEEFKRRKNFIDNI